MRKIILGIIVIVIVAAIWFVATLDNRVKSHIEKTASLLTGVAVTIDSIDLSMLQGKGIIRGLTVGNPEGYSDGNAFEMSVIEFEVDTGSAFSQPLIVDKLEFDSPLVNLEFKDDFQSNLQDILEISNRQNRADGKVESSSGQGSAAESEGQSSQTANSNESNSSQSDEDYYRMVFTLLEIKNITFNAQHGDDKWSDTVPALQMVNLGMPQGIGTRELGITVVRELTNQTLERAAKRKLTDMVKDKAIEFGSKLLEKLLEQ